MEGEKKRNEDEKKKKIRHAGKEARREQKSPSVTKKSLNVEKKATAARAKSTSRGDGFASVVWRKGERATARPRAQNHHSGAGASKDRPRRKRRPCSQRCTRMHCSKAPSLLTFFCSFAGRTCLTWLLHTIALCSFVLPGKSKLSFLFLFSFVPSLLRTLKHMTEARSQTQQKSKEFPASENTNNTGFPFSVLAVSCLFLGYLHPHSLFLCSFLLPSSSMVTTLFFFLNNSTPCLEIITALRPLRRTTERAGTSPYSTFSWSKSQEALSALTVLSIFFVRPALWSHPKPNARLI